MVRLFDGEVDVAYMQYYLETPGLAPGEDVDRRFAGQNNGLCGAGEPGMLHLVTGLHTGLVPVAVDLLDTAPGAVETGWEEVVEVSLTTTSSTVLLYDWDHGQPIELHLGGAGTFRVRYHAHGMDTGRDADVRLAGEPVLDRYLLQLWPAPPGPDTVLRQSSEIADYWHHTARHTPRDDSAGDPDDGARRAAFHAFLHEVSTARPELQRTIARWLVHRTARLAGPAATSWVQFALDALDDGRALPTPFDDREHAIAAAQRDLTTPEDDLDRADAPSETPNLTPILLSALRHAADPDPGLAVFGTLAVAQHAIPGRPEYELHDEVRARFLS